MYNVVDFGARGDGKTDDGPAFQKAVDAAIASGTHAQVSIPAGRWLLAGASATSYNHIRIDRADGLSIVGEADTVLVSDSPKSNFFRITRSSNVTIRRLTLERDPVVFSQGVVVSINAALQMVRFKVTPGYPSLDSVFIKEARYLIGFPHPELGSWGDHDAACGWYKPGDPLVCWPPKIIHRRHLADGTWELRLNTNPPPSDMAKPALVWGWDTEFKGHALLVTGTDTLLVEDVAYYAGGAGGGLVLNAGNSGEFTFRNFTVDVRPKTRDLIGAQNGSMVFNNHIKLTFDNVTIQNVWDDALNMGANFSRIYALESPRLLVVDCSRADFRVGDTITLWDWPTKQVKLHTTLESVFLANSPERSCRLTVDMDLSALHSGYAPMRTVNNDSDGIDRVISMESAGSLHIMKSKFQVLHARDLLVKATDALIESSYFHDTAMAGILIGPEFSWDEGPAVRNIAILNNAFSNVSGGNIIDHSANEPKREKVGKVVVSGNRFEHVGRFRHGVLGIPGQPIQIQNARDVRSQGN